MIWNLSFLALFWCFNKLYLYLTKFLWFQAHNFTWFGSFSLEYFPTNRWLSFLTLKVVVTLTQGQSLTNIFSNKHWVAHTYLAKDGHCRKNSVCINCLWKLTIFKGLFLSLSFSIFEVRGGTSYSISIACMFIWLCMYVQKRYIYGMTKGIFNILLRFCSRGFLVRKMCIFSLLWEKKIIKK